MPLAAAAALALIQTSLLIRPLYLEDEPPELRSAQHIVILHTEVRNVHPSVKTTPDEALEVAVSIKRKLDAGADFAEVARTYSMARSASQGAVLGTFARGMLAPPLNEFLFSAEPGAISNPIDGPAGVQILRRIDTYAAVLQILVEGKTDTAREECANLREQLDEGADFGELAREHSDDTESARVGGQYQIFERGTRDRLLKKAAFEAQLGEVVGPLETPLGFHLLKRVAFDAVDPALKEQKFIRLRSVLVAYQGAVAAPRDLLRTKAEAQALAVEIHGRISAGDDMAEIAREFDGDPTGAERGGDLGWVHRNAPGLPPLFEIIFGRPVGAVSGPIETPAGFVVVRRDA